MKQKIVKRQVSLKSMDDKEKNENAIKENIERLKRAAKEVDKKIDKDDKRFLDSLKKMEKKED